MTISATETRTPILEARALVKTYGRVVGLDGVGLKLYPGEVLAIIGDNGAGKSTLVKCLTGAEVPDTGELLLDGRPVVFKRPQDARLAGIETVYQNLAVSPALDVASNLFLGREERKRGLLGSVFRVLDVKGMRVKAERELTELGISTLQDVTVPVENLSGGQRQAVAVARAAAFGSKVVVLDEPTAALGCARVEPGARTRASPPRSRHPRDHHQPQHAAGVPGGRPHPHPTARQVRRHDNPAVALDDRGRRDHDRSPSRMNLTTEPWVAVVGDNTVDRYVGDDDVEYSGGNAFNVAVQLARSGVRVRYFGAVADDENARVIERGLRQNGIGLDDLVVLPGETAVTVIRTTEEGDRSFEREDFGVTADYHPGDDALEALASASWVHIGMLPGASALRERLAQGVRGVLSQDCAVASGLEHLDVAFLSAGEGADARALAAETVSAGVPLAIVTRGAEGSLASDGESIWTQDALPAEVVDTTGAGDSFIAGFIASRLSGGDVGQALGNGARLAAVTVSHPAGWPHPSAEADGVDALYAAVDAAVDEFAAEATALLIDLVAVRSVNPLQPGVDGSLYLGEEKRANELLAEAFRPLGFGIEWVEVAAGRPNLVAILPGAGGGRSLALNGHIDTVAPQDGRFDDPWTAVIEDGWLYGLGATDMKAGHAAMWLAARALRRAGIRLSGDLHIHSVVGEETMSHELGTTAILEAGHLVDGAIIPEPTSTAPDLLRVANAAAGNYLFSVTVRGKSTHWASRNLAIRAGGPGDEIGVNAIDKIVQVYSAMRQLEEQWAFTKTHPSFPAGAFIIHPGVLRADIGVEAAPYFPDRARIDYLLSFPPGDTSEQIAAEVEEHVGHAAAMDPWLRDHPVEFTWTDTWPPAFTDPASDFVRSVMASRSGLAAVDPVVPPLDAPVTAAAQSDANFYEAYGIPALVCGPGDVRVAHAADERVAVENIALAARMIARVAIDWCGAVQR